MAKKKNVIVEQEVDESEINNFTDETMIPEKKKIAFRVVLVTSGKVWYEVSKSIGNSTTQDIWGGKLKIGDTIYLDGE